MSLLRNPWVTGLLAAAAIGVVGYQFLPQLRSRAPAPAPPVSSPGSQVSSPPGLGPGTRDSRLETSRASAPMPAEAPGPGMDRGFLENRFASWVNAPKRDPFLLVLPQVDHPHQVATNSPVATWKLSGIWNQEGVRLAVINHRVYGEGDEIEGYRVQKIVGDEVWFLGTNGVERLGVQQHRSTPSKTAPKPPAGK